MPEGEGQGQTQAAQTTAAPDWRGFATDELKADPVVSDFLTKASEKDVPALIKGYAHATKRLGSSISLPGKEAKPEELAGIRTRLYDAGVFERPPADPKEYGIAKPETLAEGLGWSDAAAEKLGTILHKHGAPKALAADLLALQAEVMAGTQATLKTSYDQGMAALRAEHKDQFDTRMEAAKRMIPAIFKTPEELTFVENLGLGDHPAFLSVLMRLAPLALADSSFLSEVQTPGGEMTGEAVREEYAKILHDKTHPMHAAYWRGDKKAQAYVDDLYRKAYGSGQVTIGEQVVLK